MDKVLSTLGLLLTVVILSLGALQSFRMQSSYLCRGKVLSTTYRYSTIISRSALECVHLCRLQASCLSVVFDVTSRRCHFGNQSAGDACANMVAASGTQKYFQLDSPCQNGGSLKQDGNCACVNSYVGSTCARFMRDCDEGRKSGFFLKNGVYTIQPNDATQPFSIVCIMIEEVAVRNNIFSRKGNGTLTGNRTWAEYKEGFGSLTNTEEYWLGLEKLYQLANTKTYQLRARILLKNGTSFYLIYNNFVMNNESTGYSIAANSTHRINLKDAGDCITDAVGSPFSTYDRDKDNSSSSNCAARMGGGWWYNGAACSRCSLLGPNMVLNGFDDTLVSSVTYYLVL